MTDLNLPSLAAADGMRIMDNNNLARIDLSDLTSLDHRLWIQSNDSLTRIEGFDALTSIGADLSIYQQASLTSIDFPSLVAVDGLSINNNASLTSIALPSLRSAGSLNLRNVDSLPSLDGLSGLLSVSGRLDIAYNDALGDVDGLDALTSVGDDLHIVSNATLSNLDGLSSLVSVGSDVAIEDNVCLPQAWAEAFAMSITVGGNVFVTNNNGPCL